MSHLPRPVSRRRSELVALASRILPRRFSGLRRIGRSGRSAVFRALDAETGQDVAIKLDPAAGGFDSGELGRELRLLAKLDHPQVVRAHAFGWGGDGSPYLATRYVGSRTLLDVGRAADTRGLLRGLREAVLGLEAIHRLGSIHGDVKPSHLLLSSEGGGVVLVDLGLARPFGTARELTGTPGYIAPEMLRFEALDARSDWFSLGMTALRCAVEDVPRCLQDTDLAVRSRRRWREAVERCVASLPRALRAFIVSALEPDIELRVHAAGDVLDVLRAPRAVRAAQSATALARPPMFGRREARRRLLRLLEQLRGGGAVCLTLQGPAGSGKSRLTEELEVEAVLRGANVVRLQPRAGHLDVRGVVERLSAALPPGPSLLKALEPAAADGLLCGPDAHFVPAGGLELSRDVNVLLAALDELYRSDPRPLVVILDEAASCVPELSEALRLACAVRSQAHALAAALGGRPSAGPLLIVRTQAGARAEGPVLRLGPLGPAGGSRLLRWVRRFSGAAWAGPARATGLPGEILEAAAQGLLRPPRREAPRQRRGSVGTDTALGRQAPSGRRVRSRVLALLARCRSKAAGPRARRGWYRELAALHLALGQARRAWRFLDLVDPPGRVRALAPADSVLRLRCLRLPGAEALAPERMAEILAAAVRLVERGRPGSGAVAFELGLLRWREGRPREASSMLQRARRLLPRGDEARDLRAACLTALAHCLPASQAARGAELLDEARGLLGPAAGQGWAPSAMSGALAATAARGAEGARSRKHLARAAEQALRSGAVRAAALWEEHLAKAYIRLGRWSRAADLLRRSVLHATEAQAPELVSSALICLARLQLERGDVPGARRLLELERGGTPEHALLDAELLLLEGRPAAALARVRPLVLGAATAALGVAIEAKLVLARALEGLGREAQARKALQRALEASAASGLEAQRARCLRHLLAHAASAAEPDESASSWAEQLASKVKGHVDRLEAARSRAVVAQWLQRTGARREARIQARRALVLFERLGARLDLAACRRFLGMRRRRRRAPA
jgi:tetratricopeptide (TPR) repeat protein/tRNA A-37 threonylcarbamoyl transferase component Bud32